MNRTGLELLEKYEAKWGQIDRHDALAGRIDWTLADYLAEGRAEYDRISFGRDPSQREHYARAYVRINMPAWKRAEQKEIAA